MSLEEIRRRKYMKSKLTRMIVHHLLNSNNDSKDEKYELEARVATARRAADDPRIFISYVDLPPDILKKYPQLGKDAATTIVTTRDVVSQKLSVDINLAYELANMTPREIDLNPDILYSRIPIKDLLTQRLQKSLHGKGLEYVAGATPQVIERHVVPTPKPEVKEKSLKERIFEFFGGGKNQKEEVYE